MTVLQNASKCFKKECCALLRILWIRGSARRFARGGPVDWSVRRMRAPCEPAAPFRLLLCALLASGRGEERFLGTARSTTAASVSPIAAFELVAGPCELVDHCLVGPAASSSYRITGSENATLNAPTGRSRRVAFQTRTT